LIAALFDCDGTLYAAEFGRGLLKYAGSNGAGQAVRRYYTSLLPRYLLRRLRLIEDEDLVRPAIASLGRLVKGWEREQAAAAFEWVAGEFLLPTKRFDVLARLQSHQAQNHRVVLVSGVLMPCLELIGAQFGIPDLIGTQLELKESEYTGRIIPPVISGKDKAPKAREFFATRGLEVNWPASYAYADSIHDRSLFEAVGHPVAAYPDSELLELARSRGWEVIGGE